MYIRRKQSLARSCLGTRTSLGLGCRTFLLCTKSHAKQGPCTSGTAPPKVSTHRATAMIPSHMRLRVGHMTLGGHHPSMNVLDYYVESAPVLVQCIRLRTL